MKTLILLRGLPGAGKSTLAKELARGRESIHCEADQYFTKETGEYEFRMEELADAHSSCREKCWAAMQRSTDLIIVSNTFTQEWEMLSYTDMAEQFEYQVFSLIVENRHAGENVHGCPVETIERMRDRFQIQL
jgi:predicted kinase